MRTVEISFGSEMTSIEFENIKEWIKDKVVFVFTAFPAGLYLLILSKNNFRITDIQSSNFRSQRQGLFTLTECSLGISTHGCVNMMLFGS